MRVNIGKSEFEVGGPDLGELRESNAILDDVETLQARFQDEGYLLIRGLQKHETVLGARRAFLEYLDERGCLDRAAPLMDGKIDLNRGPRGGYRGDAENPRQDGAPLAQSPGIGALVESPEVIGFFERFFGGEVLAFHHRWMRAAGQGRSTGMHFDFLYMGRGTEKVCTVWCPLGDTPMDLGGLAVCLGSDKSADLKGAYEGVDADLHSDRMKEMGSLTPLGAAREFGGKWHTTNYRAGDVLIFGMYMLHAPLNNQTDRFRLSTDTRYQLEAEPVDERWVTEGHLERTFIGG